MLISTLFTGRFALFTYVTLTFLTTLALALSGAALHGLWVVLAVASGALTVVGIHDVTQRRHAILRNYPISAHMRFLLEQIRPEMRQYFFEDEKYGQPFSRDRRAIVYQRAKNVLVKNPSVQTMMFMRQALNGRRIPSPSNRKISKPIARASVTRPILPPIQLRSSTFQR